MKKWLVIMATAIMGVGSIVLPATASADWGGWGGAGWFNNQTASWIWVAWGDKGNSWNSDLLLFVKNLINKILTFLSLITIALIIWWGFQMITAAWEDGKYKKWFTIVKQAAIWLLIIWTSALVINIVFWLITTSASAW